MDLNGVCNLLRSQLAISTSQTKLAVFDVSFKVFRQSTITLHMWQNERKKVEESISLLITTKMNGFTWKTGFFLLYFIWPLKNRIFNPETNKQTPNTKKNRKIDHVEINPAHTHKFTWQTSLDCLFQIRNRSNFYCYRKKYKHEWDDNQFHRKNVYFIWGFDCILS